jgi:MFS family permease
MTLERSCDGSLEPNPQPLTYSSHSNGAILVKPELSTSPDSSSGSLPGNVWVVTLTSFLTDVSSEMVSNLLPIFLYSVLGVSTAAIGLIEGVAETTASMMKVLSGWVSDRLRSRKWLAVLGYGLSAAAKPFLYFAQSWSWVLGVRFAERAGKGIRTAPRDALVADSIAPEQRGWAFGVHRAGDTAGAMVGIGMAALLVLASQRGAIGLGHSTFQRIVLWSLAPAVLAVIVLALGVKEARPTGVRQRSDRSPSLAWGDLEPRFRNYLLILLVFTLGNSSDAFLILRAQQGGLSVLGVLGMMATFNFVYALTATPAGILSDRVGRKRLLLAGWGVYACVYLGFALLNRGWQAWLMMAVYGLFYGLTEGVAKALIADLVPAAQRGTAYGFYSAGIGLAALPASVIAGLLWQGVGSWEGLGPSAPFVWGAALAALAAVLLWQLPLPRPGGLPDAASNGAARP